MLDNTISQRPLTCSASQRSVASSDENNDGNRRGLVVSDSRAVMLNTKRREIKIQRAQDSNVILEITSQLSIVETGPAVDTNVEVISQLPLEEIAQNINAIQFPLHIDEDGAYIFIDMREDLIDESNMTLWHDAMKANLIAASRSLQSQEDRPWVLSAEEALGIENITAQTARRMITELPNRNKYVVSFNKTVSAILRCNTAMYHLGSRGQCIAIFFYLVKYISKDANVLHDSLTSIAEAIDWLKRYPRIMQAADESQEMRDIRSFMQRLLNSSQNGTREMADTTVAYANLGGQAHICSESITYNFAYDITRECRLLHGDRREHVEEIGDVEYGTIPAYRNSEGEFVVVPQSALYKYRENPLNLISPVMDELRTDMGRLQNLIVSKF